LLEIAQKEDINVSEDELQQETERTMESITSFMSDSDRKQFDSPEAVMNLAGNIYAEMRMTRTLEYLRTVAKGDLVADDAPEDDEGVEVEVTEPESGEAQEADHSVEEGELQDSAAVKAETEEKPEEESEEAQDEGLDQEEPDSNLEENQV
jgi:hypothetical protein